MIAGGKAARTLTSKARHGAVLMRIEGEARAESRAGPSVRRCSPACSSRRTGSRSPTLVMWVFTAASARSGSSERSCSSSTSRSERARKNLWKAISASMVAKETPLSEVSRRCSKAASMSARSARPIRPSVIARRTAKASGTAHRLTISRASFGDMDATLAPRRGCITTKLMSCRTRRAYRSPRGGNGLGRWDFRRLAAGRMAAVEDCFLIDSRRLRSSASAAR